MVGSTSSNPIVFTAAPDKYTTDAAGGNYSTLLKENYDGAVHKTICQDFLLDLLRVTIGGDSDFADVYHFSWSLKEVQPTINPVRLVHYFHGKANTFVPEEDYDKMYEVAQWFIHSIEDQYKIPRSNILWGQDQNGTKCLIFEASKEWIRSTILFSAYLKLSRHGVVNYKTIDMNKNWAESILDTDHACKKVPWHDKMLVILGAVLKYRKKIFPLSKIKNSWKIINDDKSVWGFYDLHNFSGLEGLTSYVRSIGSDPNHIHQRRAELLVKILKEYVPLIVSKAKNPIQFIKGNSKCWSTIFNSAQTQNLPSTIAAT